MTHVRISPYHPQSNENVCWHKSLKGERIRQVRLSTGNAAVAGGCAAAGGGLRRALRRCPFEQCHWLHHAEGHARRPPAGDPRGARPEVEGGAEATADSPPASRVTFSSRPLGVVLDRYIHIAAGAEPQLPVCRRSTRRGRLRAAQSRSSYSPPQIRRDSALPRPDRTESGFPRLRRGRL